MEIVYRKFRIVTPDYGFVKHYFETIYVWFRKRNPGSMPGFVDYWYAATLTVAETVHEPCLIKPLTLPYCLDAMAFTAALIERW